MQDVVKNTKKRMQPKTGAFELKSIAAVEICPTIYIRGPGNSVVIVRSTLRREVAEHLADQEKFVVVLDTPIPSYSTNPPKQCGGPIFKRRQR
jgi:hypothetical protein